MQRRTAVKLIALGTGALLIPSCNPKQPEVITGLDNLKISRSQQSLLQDVINAIVPQEEAQTTKLSDFVIRMIDDCAEKQEQQAFEKGLAALDEYAKGKAGDDFSSLKQKDRENVLSSLEKEASEKSDSQTVDPLHTFYRMTKSLTIRGYLNSEPVMTNLTYYKMVPGRFDGCVEIKDPSDYKTIFG